MTKFTCQYLTNGNINRLDTVTPKKKFQAESAQEAAYMYADQCPSSTHTCISVQWGLTEISVIYNPGTEIQRQQREATLLAARVESLKELVSKVENTNGNLRDLSCDDLNALVENLRDFPEIRETLEPEERAVREHLYKVAFFDRDLQAGLQTSLLNQIASGQPTAGVASSGQSNLVRNAAMLGGVAALQKLNQIEENTGDVSEGLGFD